MDARTDVFQSVQDVSMLLMARQHEPWLPVRPEAALSGPAPLLVLQVFPGTRMSVHA